MKWPYSLRKRSLLKSAKKLSAFFKPRRRHFWRSFGVYVFYAFFASMFATAIAFAWFSKDLPTPSKIANRKPTISTKLYDRTGEILLYETGEQKRTIVNSADISLYLKDATVATEDANFYRHKGIDPRAIATAVMEKLTGKRQVARGGSTITQQYVKNALLSSDRSIVRKIKEAILSVELEFMFDKDEILTMYLNEIPYGNATAGAEAASRTYFGKTAKDLTIAEAATLAAIPKAPTYYSPYGTHVAELKARRNYVIDQMVKHGKISEADALTAKGQDTTTIGTTLKPRRDSILAPHFVMYVLEQIADEYGEAVIQREGLKIITTLDYEKQKAAEEAVAGGVPKLARYGASNAALVALDPKTGQVLAMVGSKDYFDASIDGNVNVADSPRQPGSSFKPIAYATAFKKPEFSPSKILFDLETDFGGNPPYIPHNYNGKNNGPVTMRFALANSLNVPAVKVMSLVGLDNALRTAEDLGITTLTQRDRYGLSLVLGAGEVKPVEMAGAFSVFATGGVKNEVIPVLKIVDAKGKTLYEAEKDQKRSKQVLDAQVAYEISHILSDNQTRSAIFGLRSALFFPNRTVAVKTGTTSDFKDAWTVGFTPSISVAVWTGNSNAAKMKSGADGSVLAAPIFHQFIEKALANVPNEEFARPAGIVELTVEKYSNKQPGPYSTETTADIFASWQVPKEEEDVHRVANICRGTNLLAPSSAPAGLAEERVFTIIHSERPDNAKWENPVRSWAQAHGMISDVPKDYCDPNALMPTISIVSPANNSTVSGETTIVVATGGAASIQSVEYFIDGVSIGRASQSPFNLSFNFSSLVEGSHKLVAVATEGSGITSQSEVSFLASDATGPSISQVSARVDKGQNKAAATVSWLTGEPSYSIIRYWTDENINTPLIEEDKDVDLNHQVRLEDLTLGTKYYFTITAYDLKNNSITSGEYTFQTPAADKK